MVNQKVFAWTSKVWGTEMCHNDDFWNSLENSSWKKPWHIILVTWHIKMLRCWGLGTTPFIWVEAVICNQPANGCKATTYNIWLLVHFNSFCQVHNNKQWHELNCFQFMLCCLQTTNPKNMVTNIQDPMYNNFWKLRWSIDNVTLESMFVWNIGQYVTINEMMAKHNGNHCVIC
jgi:hypothetical protein